MKVIGIMPTIDGREKGVREGLEEQTRWMAQAAAKLISSELKDRHGDSIKCIIADTTIGGIAEAAACQENFDKSGVGATLTVTPCWCYGSEVMDMDRQKPKAIWGFNGTERPGAVFLAAASAAYAQKGIPVYTIYGHDVQDSTDKIIPDDVGYKILQFVKSAVAVNEMKGKSYLSVGNVSMGIAGSMVNPSFFEKYLAMRCEYKDMSEIIRRVDNGIYNKEEFSHAQKWIKEHCREGRDNNKKPHSRSQKDSEWEYCIKMAMIMRDMMQGSVYLREHGWNEEGNGHYAIAAGFQGQRQWTDFMPNGDFMEAILCSSFDWNGIREPYIVATENDSLNAVSMLFGHLLTNSASIFCDVRTYWSPQAVKRVTGEALDGIAKNGVIHLINSGAAALDATGCQSINGLPAMKPYWNITDDEAKKCLRATTWYPANLDYFRGGGFSSNFKSNGGMPITVARINIIGGLGPAMQIAEGYTCELNDIIHNALDQRTDPTWPTTWFVPILTGEGAFTDVYSVMAHWGANHCVFNYGHIGADLITLAAMLRIPVNMHNVSKDRIFRPSVWNSFGTQDSEGADYRACKAYGPLYA